MPWISLGPASDRHPEEIGGSFPGPGRVPQRACLDGPLAPIPDLENSQLVPRGGILAGDATTVVPALAGFRPVRILFSIVRVSHPFELENSDGEIAPFWEVCTRPWPSRT